MSRHESAVRLRHMLGHSREAVVMSVGANRQILENDRKLNLALVRLLEILGEAAGRTPAAERAKYPQIPWSQIGSLRNRLIHGYDSVDFDILWEIISRDLPPLIAELEQIVSSIDDDAED